MKYFTLIGIFILAFATNVSSQLVCNSFVNVSLDDNGEALLFADLFLEGMICTDCTVSVSDENGNVIYQPALNVVVDCFDTFETLVYTVTEPNGNQCWGEMLVEDKLEVCDFGGPGLVINGVCSSQHYQLTLNNNELLNDLNACVRILPDLLPGINEVGFEYDDIDFGLNGVSTLDLVLIQQGIFGGFLTPLEAILTDIDNDGAVSTIDLVRLRLGILGAIDATELASFRIVDQNEDFSDFNQYDFDPKYETLQFEDSYFDTNVNLHVDIYKIGDINATISMDTLASQIEVDSRSSQVIGYANPYLEMGQSYDIAFELNADDLKGMTFGFEIPGVAINSLVSDQASEIMSNIDESSILISYLSDDVDDHLRFTLNMTADQNGRLSDMISLSDDLSNDLVTANLKIFNLEIEADAVNEVDETIVYPNPVDDVLHIRFATANQDVKKEVSLRGVDGKNITNYQTYGDLLTIDRSLIGSSGLYFIETRIENEVFTSKVFVE